jgi:hypothetical protein
MYAPLKMMVNLGHSLQRGRHPSAVGGNFIQPILCSCLVVTKTFVYKTLPEQTSPSSMARLVESSEEGEVSGKKLTKAH